MHKLILALITTLLLSSPTKADEKNDYLITNDKLIQLLAEASHTKPRERRPYLLALIRQGEKNVFDRICTVRLKEAKSVAIVNLQTATACQFLSWHNIRLLKGLITEDQARRFSEEYFDYFVKTNL